MANCFWDESNLADGYSRYRQTIPTSLLTAVKESMINRRGYKITGIKTILDVGCGPGNLTESLLHVFPSARIIGLDVSQAQLNVAKATFANMHTDKVEFRRHDASAGLPVRPHSVDLIVVATALHWLDTGAFMRHAKAALTDAGVLAVCSTRPRGSSLTLTDRTVVDPDERCGGKATALISHVPAVWRSSNGFVSYTGVRLLVQGIFQYFLDSGYYDQRMRLVIDDYKDIEFPFNAVHRHDGEAFVTCNELTVDDYIVRYLSTYCGVTEYNRRHPDRDFREEFRCKLMAKLPQGSNSQTKLNMYTQCLLILAYD